MLLFIHTIVFHLRLSKILEVIAPSYLDDNKLENFGSMCLFNIYNTYSS